MPTHHVIDGNNVLHATGRHGPGGLIGRETLLRKIEMWAQTHDERVTVVFDGSIPTGGMALQLASDRITVQFSQSQTADDVIIDLIGTAERPAELRVITSDRAIQHAARYKKCAVTESAEFVAECFSEEKVAPESASEPSEEPPVDDTDWLEHFNIEDREPPFDGYEAMRGE